MLKLLLFLLFNFLTFRHDQTSASFCKTSGAESKVCNIHICLPLPINPHLSTEYTAMFLMCSYLACIEATVLGMIFIADIRWKFIQKNTIPLL